MRRIKELLVKISVSVYFFITSVIFLAVGVVMMIAPLNGRQEDTIMYMGKMVVMFVGIILLGLGAYMWIVFCTTPNQNPKLSRPRVRVWEINGITRVCPEQDWEIAVLLRERYEIVWPIRKFGVRRRIDPEFGLIFSDNKHMPPKTGSMKDLQTLLSGCRVDRTEMEIPDPIKKPSGWLVSFSEAWMLIHGIGTKPPENNRIGTNPSGED